MAIDESFYIDYGNDCAPRFRWGLQSQFLNVNRLQFKIPSSYNAHCNQTSSILNVVIKNEGTATCMVSHWGHNCIFDASRS